MTFDAWINKVDAFLQSEVGLCHDDMEDHLWYDAFEDGTDPEDEARDFLYEIGFYLD